MSREARRRDRLVGLFALGLVLLNPPLLWLVADGTLSAWPLPFLYLFCAWGLVTVLIALTVERRRLRSSRASEED